MRLDLSPGGVLEVDLGNDTPMVEGTVVECDEKSALVVHDQRVGQLEDILWDRKAKRLRFQMENGDFFVAVAWCDEVRRYDDGGFGYVLTLRDITRI